jgi:hypothetical protein
MSPRDQFRASHAIGRIESWINCGAYVPGEGTIQAIRTLINIIETAAAAEAAPASTSANGPEQSGVGAAYREI